MSPTLRLTICMLLSSQLLLACANRAPLQESSPPRMVATVPGKTEPDANPPTKACANCPTPDPDYAPTSDEVPEDIANSPDAVPTVEPRSRYGNPENYEALGKTYKVMREPPKGFRERGRASWYGKKFHGRRTANGETYNMFTMTAAHKTLPLPSYVRVTNKGNGRSVVVRVNDRGPFHPGRIIDLSYAAASKIDLLHHGSAEVELELLSAQQGERAAESKQSQGKPRYLEVGRFADPIEAIALRDRLAALGYSDTELLQTRNPAGDGDENILRIGPFKVFSKLEAARLRLGKQDIATIPVAD